MWPFSWTSKRVSEVSFPSKEFTELQNQITLCRAAIEVQTAKFQGIQLELQQIRDDILKIRKQKHLAGSSTEPPEPARIPQGLYGLNPFA